MVGLDGLVKEFKSYEEIMISWFGIRKSLYIQRIDREIIILELLIMFHKELLRFIDMDKKAEIDIDEKTTEEREVILAEAKFIRFNREVLMSPSGVKTIDLRVMVLSGKAASYRYIYTITKMMTELSAMNKLRQKIQDLELQLKMLKETTWQKIWLTEIDELTKSIELGIRTDWTFGTKERVFKSGRSD
jgi:hypothetical protein